MIGNLIAIAMLLAVTVAIAFGIRAAWRTRKAHIRWPAAVFGSLFVVIGLVLTTAASRGVGIAYVKGGRPVKPLTVERTPERVARGKHIVGNWCVACHSPTHDLPAQGGVDLAKEIPFPIGSLTSGNLTPAGRIKDWTDGEVFRAIREGVDPQGNKLLVMSGQYARFLSDEDLMSVIAFLRTQEPTGADVPRGSLTLIGLAMGGANMFPRSDDAPESIPPVTRGETVEYGKYMVGWMNCRECHGVALSGSKGGILPPAPSLRTAQSWTTDQFVQTLKTGTNPFGKKLDPAMMPWKNIGRFDEDELRAIHLYLKSIEIPLADK